MTLTEAAFFTKRFAPFGIIGILVILIFYYSFQLLVLVGENQPKPQNSTVITDLKFKLLPPISLNEATPSGNINYILDTIDGTAIIPNATTAAKVIFLPQEPPRFGFLPRIYTVAQDIGFDTETIKHQLEDQTAIFADGLRRLTIDITNFNFTYKYTLTKEDSILQGAQVPADPKQIEIESTEFLRKTTRYPEELAQGKRNIVYLRFDPVTTELSIVQSAADANMVEVDYYRPDIDGVPVVPPKYFNSPHYTVFAYNASGSKVIRAQVNFFAKSLDQVGIYPIKTSEDAWKQLQEGKGFIVNADTISPDVKIKKILLAYLDPEVYQLYMQPVYVFLGDNNFVAYVPAIQDNLILEKQ